MEMMYAKIILFLHIFAKSFAYIFRFLCLFLKKPLYAYNGAAAPQRSRCTSATRPLRPSGAVVRLQRSRCLPAKPLYAYNRVAAPQRGRCTPATAIRMGLKPDKRAASNPGNELPG